MEGRRNILIIDADEGVSAPLCDYFGRQGVFCRVAKTLGEGKALLGSFSFDAVIAELDLADGRSTALLKESGMPPVIILSENAKDEEIIEALSLGAADYILKPCSPPVTAARLAARVPLRERRITCRRLTLDVLLRTASFDGRLIKLTSSEFNILCFLMAHPGQFFTADEIYERVWKMPSMQTSVVRFHISNLKKTILSVTGKNLILSGFGMGYAFAPED